MPVIVVDGTAEAARAGKVLTRAGISFRLEQDDGRTACATEAPEAVHIGTVVIDRASFTVRTPDSVICLPKKEFLLLFKLSSSVDRVFTRKQLIETAWGRDSSISAHTLDVHMSRLRGRFRRCPDFAIATVRGVGYKLVPSAEAHCTDASDQKASRKGAAGAAPCSVPI